MIRKIILAALGILLVVGAYRFSKKDTSKEKEWTPAKEEKLVVGAFVETVFNTNTPITINASGNLMAKNQVDIYAEVQGTFKSSSRPFKPGTYYKKGAVLLELDKTEEVLSLIAEKSSFYNQLVLLMPDLKLDYPKSFKKWDKYLSDFNINRPLEWLPEPKSKQEKLFLSGKNIYAAFYNLKNSEVQLKNYTIHAPFSGVLIEALVNPGALVRPGQKLGAFINQDVYELEVAINTAYSDLLSIGKTVSLYNVENTKEWTGKVVRINKFVDVATQTIPTFIQVSGNDLSPGMYLSADITVKEAENTYEINRQLLVDDNQVFIVRDSVLDLAYVTPVFLKKNTVVVEGLADGMQLLSKAIPSAHVGMRVKVIEDKTTAFWD